MDRFLDGQLMNLRFALRSLAKSPGVAVTIVLTIALAIGANTLIFSLVDSVLLDGPNVADPDTLVRLYSTHEGDAATAGSFGSYLPSSFPNYEDLRDRSRTIDHLAAYTLAQVGLARDGRAERASAVLATPQYFAALGVEPHLGRTFRPEDEERARAVVVLSYGLWRDRFGAQPRIVGRTVPINGRDHEVIGVAPAGFHGVDTLFRADLWLPTALYPQIAPPEVAGFIDHRRGLMFQVLGRLGEDASLAQARSEMTSLAKGLADEYPTWNEDRGIALLPLPLSAIDPNQRTIWVRSGQVLAVVVGLLLLLACANVANLLLVRWRGRRREMAIRLSLGASRGRLGGQVLAESLLLAAAGGIAGIGLAVVSRDFVWRLRPPFLADSAATPTTLDPTVLVFATAATLVTGVLFGLGPVLAGRHANLTESLKAEGTAEAQKVGQPRLTQILVVTQLAVAVVALVGASLFLRSLTEGLAIDPGFETERLLTARIDPGAAGYDPARARRFLRRAVEEVEALPGVQSAAVAATRPLALTTADPQRRTGPLDAEEPPEEAGVLVGTRVVGEGYFTTTGVAIEEGRSVSSADGAQSRPVAVINRKLSETFWPGRSGVGRSFRFSGQEQPIEVVGVAADAKYQTLGEEPRPFIYLPLGQASLPAATLHVATQGEPTPLLASVRDRLRSLDPSVPLSDLEPISATLRGALWGPRAGASLLGSFSMLALVLAAIGLYGVLAHNVARRRREIGIRIALGARRWEVVGRVVRQALAVTGFGLGLGILVAAAGARLIEDLLYQVRAHDPWAFGTTCTVLLIAATMAALVPASRAARTDPLEAIRED